MNLNAMCLQLKQLYARIYAHTYAYLYIYTQLLTEYENFKQITFLIINSIVNLK